jgi:hypothetical protein
MRRKDRLVETDKELVNAIDTVIHDFNNLHSMMRIYLENENNPDYSREFNWTSAKEYYEKYGFKVKEKVAKMCDILYEKEK